MSNNYGKDKDMEGAGAASHVEPVGEEEREQEPAAVDVLQLTKPIQEYVEFNSWLADVYGDVPDYVFRINDVSHLFQGVAELKGKEFPVPALDRKAQIKCKVEHGEFEICLRILHPTLGGLKTEMEAEVNPIVTTVLKASAADVRFDKKLSFAYPFLGKCVYEDFLTIFTLPYDDCVERYVDLRTDSLTLPLFITSTVPRHIFSLEFGQYLPWRVDVAHLKFKHGASFAEKKQVGFSPLVGLGPDGPPVKAQLRLFVQGVYVGAEARIFSQSNDRLKSMVVLSLVHPSGPTKKMRIEFAEEDFNWRAMKKILSPLTTVDELLPFICDNKLLFHVQFESREIPLNTKPL